MGVASKARPAAAGMFKTRIKRIPFRHDEAIPAQSPVAA